MPLYSLGSNSPVSTAVSNFAAAASKLSLKVSIDIDGPRPQFEQIIEQIKAAVTAGILKPGNALPSIRQLANDFELNSKTVAKAYKLLERDSSKSPSPERRCSVHVPTRQQRFHVPRH